MAWIMISSGESLHVDESKDSIDYLINECNHQFINPTLSTEKESVLINVNHIVYITP